MMNRHEERKAKPEGPYPDVRSAFTLTLLAMIAAGFTGVAFIDFGLLAAVGIGQAIGVGAIATMGAQRVAEPQAERLGLRALDPAAIPAILCLTPAILLVSELDNHAADWSRTTESTIERSAPAPNTEIEPADIANDGTIGIDSAGDGDGIGSPPHGFDPVEANAGSASEPASPIIDPDDPWSLVQALIVMVGISPVVEEFLFRGVIQQGLVQRLGLVRGVAMVALLWTLLRPAPLAGWTRFFAAALASFAMGWALGIVRIATRSILGSILLASSWAAVGLAAVALEGRVDLPGLNVEDSHLPLVVTLSSLLVVGWAGWMTFQEAERQFGIEAG
ncbi:MAG TPA: CPBP family intramembrane metalloprotease, partial [Deltaproteobacteria bacterium]|nr:CPBP family intramembrane metalloprotease [Deltaproteobacteria bacterium]